MNLRFSRRRRVLALCCALLLLFTACSAAKPAEDTKAVSDLNGVSSPTAGSGAAPEGSGSAPEGSASAPESAGSPEAGSPEAGASVDYSSISDGSKRMGVYDKSSVPGSFYGSEGASEPIPKGTTEPGTPEQASGLVLTAAEWNDNSNWPFFTNLVSGGTVSFPAFGIDPRNRILATVQDEAGNALANETVALTAEDGSVLWTARTDHDGKAFLFFGEGQTPAAAICGEASAPVQIRYSGAAQGSVVYRQAEEVTLVTAPTAPEITGLQIMFIVDTTGSMGDELAYLQKDFSAIAQRVEAQNVSYCACFYRDEGDEYVTRVASFSSDIRAIQAQIAAEYADGGGDEPEAVDRILTETLRDFEGWREDCVKLAFLIFDAPPHEGTDARLTAAVRAAAEQGIRLIPVVASNAERNTELFGRAIAICTGGTYVFLTDDSGVGESHLEPIVGNYEVKLLQDLIVEIIARYQP